MLLKAFCFQTYFLEHSNERNAVVSSVGSQLTGYPRQFLETDCLIRKLSSARQGSLYGSSELQNSLKKHES